jgi:hypothetical protein
VVDEIKRKSADLIDMLEYMRDNVKNGEQARCISLAMTSYEEAAMWAVKAATA